MSAPFAADILSWRKPRGKIDLVPGIADSSSDQSVLLATSVMEYLEIGKDRIQPHRKDPGKILEEAVRNHLNSTLKEDHKRESWQVARGREAQDFAQYSHLRAIQELLKGSPELRVTIGTDYLVKPDVTVGIPDPKNLLGKAPRLHAAVSCKWTIRSDRVQNIRHEFNGLIRHRRGRQPHLVTVTAEPLPTRIVAIARGTGEIDTVYHIAFGALDQAVDRLGNAEQKSAWNECKGQRRVLPYEQLVDTLISW